MRLTSEFFHGILTTVNAPCISDIWVLLNVLLAFKIFLYVCVFSKDNAKRYISLSGPVIYIFCIHVVRDLVPRVEGSEQERQERASKGCKYKQGQLNIPGK